MILDRVVLIPSTIALSISILACLYLFCHYTTVQRKTIGLKMILILGISDFLGHVFLLTSMWSHLRELTRYMIHADRTIIRFTIIWVSCIAFVIYRFLRDDGVDVSEKNSRKLLLTLSLVNIIINIGYSMIF